MAKNKKIQVQGAEITVVASKEQDYISLTDIAKSKEGDGRAADIIKNWIRNRGTIEFIGTWELLHNPEFKVVEFDHFRMNAGLTSFVLSPGRWVYATEADLLNMALFGKTAKQWRDENPSRKGNIRDYANVSQL